MKTNTLNDTLTSKTDILSYKTTTNMLGNFAFNKTIYTYSMKKHIKTRFLLISKIKKNVATITIPLIALKPFINLCLYCNKHFVRIKDTTRLNLVFGQS